MTALTLTSVMHAFWLSRARIAFAAGVPVGVAFGSMVGGSGTQLPNSRNALTGLAQFWERPDLCLFLFLGKALTPQGWKTAYIIATLIVGVFLVGSLSWPRVSERRHYTTISIREKQLEVKRLYRS
ncbi:hypothetical protein F4604DRAFT_1928169 [Suillus subluteus]|nr:hypothetical protein F4604DRAFT_1928169 [Suillus subluteus]